MKHAFLITTYCHFDLLRNLIESLNHSDSMFYIHIDKKYDSVAQASSDIEKIKKLPNVMILSHNIKVNWGAFSHSQAIILLLKEAIKNPEIEYFHTISAQDFPIFSISKILSFFEESKKQNLEYMSQRPIPAPTKKRHQVRDWFLYYHFNDHLNPKIKLQWQIIRMIVLVQEILHIKRHFPKGFEQLYRGHIWWSLSRNAILYLLEYINDNPSFVNRFKHTHCSEEIIFQTIIMHSPYAKNVVTNNLRYVEMQGSSPKILKSEDYDMLINSDKLFARKIAEESMPLVEMLKKNIEKRIY